jgi:cytoskeleton protein RodZ
MSDLRTSSSEQHAASAAGAGEDMGNADAQDAHAGAGELLRRAREAAGLHIAALAVSLKVPVKKLEALESDRFDLLPDAVFVRALASSVCRTLKIDAAPILARLPQTHAPKLTYQGVGINTPFRSPGDGPSPSVWAQISRPAVLAGLVLLLGALVLIMLPAVKTGVSEVKSEIMGTLPNTLPASEPEKQASATAAAQIFPTDMAAVPASTTYAPVSVMSGNGMTSSVTATSTPTLPKTTLTVTNSSPLPVSDSKIITKGTATPTFVISPGQLGATDVVVFNAKAETWVEATDANGQVVLRRILNAGEVVGASGTLPLKVVVGRANNTQVQIRGKAFDLNAVAKDNVARFEVK